MFLFGDDIEWDVKGILCLKRIKERDKMGGVIYIIKIKIK